jgi:RNA 3'-terminal phosphate cyclase
VKEAWGYPSGVGRAQVGRSGRQAKRCPNMRAEGSKETTGPADRLVAEWNIADHGIEEVSRKLRLFEGLRMDIRIRVELTGDSSGYGIKLHAGTFRVGIKTFRHHAEEMAHTH